MIIYNLGCSEILEEYFWLVIQSHGQRKCDTTCSECPSLRGSWKEGRQRRAHPLDLAVLLKTGRHGNAPLPGVGCGGLGMDWKKCAHRWWLGGAWHLCESPSYNKWFYLSSDLCHLSITKSACIFPKCILFPQIPHKFNKIGFRVQGGV